MTVNLLYLRQEQFVEIMQANPNCARDNVDTTSMHRHIVTAIRPQLS